MMFSNRTQRSAAEPVLSCEHAPADLGTYLLRELPGDVLSCIVIAVLLTLLVAPFLFDGHFNWLSALLFNGIASLGIGLSVSNALRFLVPPLQRRFPGAGARLAIHVAVALAGTVLGVEIAVRVIDALGGMSATSLRPDVLRVGIVIVSIVLAIDLGYERLRRRARRDEMRAEQARKEALRAQLKALQARTNPHFLFNSLNTVAGLIEEDPAGAERVLGHLAELFRYSLKGSEGGWVRLGDELAAVESYLEVETIRLGDRLRTEISVPEELREVLVPPLILQPLVENAVLHAIGPRKRGGSVRVSAERRDGSLTLTVEDDGRGPGSSPHRGSGTSLAELEERLEILYAGASTFEAASRGNGDSSFRAEMSLPLEATP